MNVLIDKQKIDNLANAIAVKSGETAPLTLTEMVQAVDGIDTSGITPTGNIDITHGGVTNVTSYSTARVPFAEPFVGVEGGFVTQSGARKWRIRPHVDFDDGQPVGWLGVSIDGEYSTYNAVPSGTTIVPSTSSQTVGGRLYMMEDAVTVSAMPTGTAGTPTATKGAVSNHSISVTPSVTNSTGYITGSTKTGTAVTVSASELVSGTKSIEANGTNIDVTNYASVDVAVSAPAPTIDSLSITPTESSQTFNSSSVDGYKPVTVGAISSTYVGSGITHRDDTDLTASGATVTVPAGYYADTETKSVATGSVTVPSTINGGSTYQSWSGSTLTLSKTVAATPTVTTPGYVSSGTQGNTTISLSTTMPMKTSADLTVSGDTVTAPSGYYSSSASKSVASGTEGTPTATKGTVSNYAVSVTPSVTNSAGYISGGTHTGTAVSVSASELVSGTYTVDSSGTKDVTNYASASVPSGTAGTPSATKGAVSNHSVSVTPSVTNTTGWITGSTKTGTAVTVSASELVSGNKEITSNGSDIDVTNYATVSVSVSSGSSASIVDTTDAGGGTIRTITVDEVVYLGAKSITENGTYDPSDDDLDGYSSVTVNVPSGASSLQTKTATYTPTTSQQTDTITPDSGYDGLEQVGITIAAMPTMTLPSSTSSTSSGTSKATISRSTSNQYLNIPTGYNGTAQYYTISATPNGTVTAPSTISGTSATVSTGTNTLTLSKTVSVTPSVTTAGYVSSGTAGNSSVSLTANVTTKAAATITPGTADQTIASGTYLTGTQTISGDADLIASNIKKDVSIFGVTGTYEGSGSGTGLTVATATSTLSSANSSISFTGLAGEPTSFAVVSASDLATGASPYKTAEVVFDGTDLHGQIVTNTSNAQASYDSSFTKSYSSGTLTITGSGTNFQANQYKLVYTYGGSDIGTADVQVGSGATSITFTGLEEEPSYFSCIFKSNFSTSSGYQRVIGVVYDGTSTYGVAMGSGAIASTTYWSYTYNSGSLTITSNGTNAGGYFHQPGYYQLTYAVEGSSGNYQNKTVTPSASQQVITADSGYDALKKVTVEGDADLIASNIKNGTTIFGVTGSYTGSGGSSTVATATATASGRPTSLSFTVSGQPIAFFCRCTSAMSRSSNSSYYYVADMRYNGTDTTGNCWRMSNGNWTNITSGYSYSYSSGTLTLSSSGTSTTSPGSFYNNGNYELVYVY